MMRRLKQIVLFLLVVITIYSTMLFYLLMSEIDYLEKTKLQNNAKVLYIDRLVPINDRLHHFSISRVSHKEPRAEGCQLSQYRQGVLLIAASSFDTITIYPRILRELEAGVAGGCVPEVFVLKRLHPLILNTEQNINKYAYEIGEVMRYFILEAEFQLSIFTHEEGALLTLVYLVGKNMNHVFSHLLSRINTIVFVDLTHPFLRVEYDPPYKLLYKLKLQVMLYKERVRLFNQLKFVIVTTHKEDNLNEHFFYPLGQHKYVFAKTLLISSREMANVHYFLPPNSLSFPPLIRRLAHMLAKDFVSNLTIDEISSFLRHGESYGYERKGEEEFEGCGQVSMATASEVEVMGQCLKLSPFQLEEEEALIMYSSNHFQVYANNYERVYPFDNLTEGSTYVFQRMSYPLYILNPYKAHIQVHKQMIASPRSPLQINEEDLLFSSQLIFSNYSVVRICPNVLLTFPLHFAQGNIHRRFLGEGQDNCFIESSLFQNFSWQLFLNWSLFRNMVLFTLMCSILRKEPVSERLIQQFSINMMIIIVRDSIENKITCGIYIVAFSIVVESLNKVIQTVTSFFSIKQPWGSSVLLAISAICISSSFFDWFNYWKLFGVVVVFFINEQSLPFFMIKLYFLKEEFPFNTTGYDGITDLGLLTMWIYTSLPHNQLPSLEDTYWSAEQVFTSALLLGMAMGIEWSGNTIETFITIYMKLMIVLRMLRILRK